MIYGYIRVSTESQTTENQRMQIMQYCKQVKVKNVSWYSETISGTLQPQVRKLGVLLHQLQAGDRYRHSTYKACGYSVQR